MFSSDSIVPGSEAMNIPAANAAEVPHVTVTSQPARVFIRASIRHPKLASRQR
jgi:hypothetical protein